MHVSYDLFGRWNISRDSLLSFKTYKLLLNCGSLLLVNYALRNVRRLPLMPQGDLQCVREKKIIQHWRWRHAYCRHNSLFMHLPFSHKDKLLAISNDAFVIAINYYSKWKNNGLCFLFSTCEIGWRRNVFQVLQFFGLTRFSNLQISLKDRYYVIMKLTKTW